MIKHSIHTNDDQQYHPTTRYSSMIHDVIYQYKRYIPATKPEADWLFFDMNLLLEKYTFRQCYQIRLSIQKRLEI